MAEKLTKDFVEAFSKLDLCCVSDALDKLGIKGALYGIKPLTCEGVLCGTAFTVHYIPCGTVKGTVGDFLDDVMPGEVVVIDNSGRTDCTVWGGLMSLSATKRGVAGTIIDGVCRDVPEVKRNHYKMFSKGYYMSTGKDRVEVDAVNTTVSVSGVQVKPGDIILADDTGALCVPAERARDVYDVALAINTQEDKIAAEIEKGVTLREARASVNYHKLQTKQ